MRRLLIDVAFFILVSQALQGQSRGPVLTAGTANGQSTFRIGERVPLVLSFSAEEENRYQVNTATYDRSGRMNYESFDVGQDRGGLIRWRVITRWEPSWVEV